MTGIKELTEELQGLYEKYSKNEYGAPYDHDYQTFGFRVYRNWPTILAALKAADELAEAGKAVEDELFMYEDALGRPDLQDCDTALNVNRAIHRRALASYTAIREDEK